MSWLITCGGPGIPDAQRLVLPHRSGSVGADLPQPGDLPAPGEPSRLNAVTNNRYYLDFYDRMIRTFDQYMQRRGNLVLTHLSGAAQPPDRLFLDGVWPARDAADLRRRPGCAFRATILKEASDLGLPLVAIGLLLYRGLLLPAASPKTAGRKRAIRPAHIRRPAGPATATTRTASR